MATGWSIPGARTRRPGRACARADLVAGADRGDWPLLIARLAAPASPPLQRLALDAWQLQVPAADQARFRDDYHPRLRQMARVISADGSFTPPEIPDPTLVLCASYGAGHELDLRWEWGYEVGESRRRAPLSVHGDPGTGI